MHKNGIDIKKVMVDVRLTLKETGIKDNRDLKDKKNIFLDEISKDEFININN